MGTLDSLLALSDDLVKVNAAVEGTVNKIRRQLFDLQARGRRAGRVAPERGGGRGAAAGGRGGQLEGASQPQPLGAACALLGPT